MASIIKDHHNFARNLKTGSNWISGDGDDEGIKVGSTGQSTFKSKPYCAYIDGSSKYIVVGTTASGGSVHAGDIESSSGSEATYTIKDANKDFVVQVWFNAKNDGSGGLETPNCHLMSCLKPYTTWGWAVGIYGSKLWVHIGDDDDATGYTQGVVNNTTILPDTWYHALYYFDRSGNAYGYLNGVYTAPTSALDISSRNGNLYQSNAGLCSSTSGTSSTPAYDSSSCAAAGGTWTGTTSGSAVMYIGRSQLNYPYDDWANTVQNYKGYLQDLAIWRDPAGVSFTPGGDGTNATATLLYNSGEPVNLYNESSYSGTFSGSDRVAGVLKGWWKLDENDTGNHPYDSSTSLHYGDIGPTYSPTFSTRSNDVIVTSGADSGIATKKAEISDIGLKLNQNLLLNDMHISNDGQSEGLRIDNLGNVRIPGPLVLGGNKKAKLLSNAIAGTTYLESQSDGGISFVGDWQYESTLKLSLNDNHAVDLVISRAGSDRAGGRLRLAGSPTEAQMMLGTIEFAKEEQADVAENAKLGALITSTSYGATGDSSMPANLTFSTTRTSSITPTPVMTITHEGKVGINLPPRAYGNSSSDASSGNNSYLKNMVQPAETFEIFGDEIYSVGRMNVTATAGSDSGTGNQMWGEADSSDNAPTLTADHIGCRVILHGGVDAGTIATYVSGSPDYYTLVDSSGSAININHVATTDEDGAYQIFAPTFKVNTATGKVTCGTIEALAIGDSKNKASYDGTDFKIENTGKFAVGDTGTYINQPADGRLAVVSDGDVELTPSAISGKKVKVIKTITSTDAGDDYTALSIDLLKSGGTTSDNTMYALKVNASNPTATNGLNVLYGISNTPTLTHAADAGTVQVIGLTQTVTSSSNGNTKAFGIYNTVTGADTNTGIWQNVTDGGTDLKFISSADSGDYFTIATTTHGATTFTTNDDDANAANLTLNIDGDINLNAHADVNIPANIGLTLGGDTEKIEGNGGDLKIESGRHLILDIGGLFFFDSELGVFQFQDDGDADDAFQITVVGGTGATTLETLSDGADGHLSLDPDGDLYFTPTTEVRSQAPIKLKERASAVASAATYGQVWVKNSTPNELYFTTDAGDDIQITSGTSMAGGGGSTTLKHWMDWYIYSANLATQNYFYTALHNDEWGVSSSINTDLSSSGYSTTTLNNAWRMIRTSRRVPYAGTITKFMVHLESTGAAADSDVEVALWWADALADDTAHGSTDNFTCDHLCTLTFDFSSASKFMSKQTTSFNATAISEGDWLFITMRKTTSGDGSSFHCHPTILWDGA